MRGGGYGDDDAKAGRETPESDVDVDEFYRLLSAAQRRHTLYFLQERSRATLAELSDVLAGWRATRNGCVVGPRERERIRTTLHHSHLPAFETAGIAVYDRDDREVSLSPSLAPVSSILRLARTYDERSREEAGNSDRNRSQQPPRDR